MAIIWIMNEDAMNCYSLENDRNNVVYELRRKGRFFGKKADLVFAVDLVSKDTVRMLVELSLPLGQGSSAPIPFESFLKLRDTLELLVNRSKLLEDLPEDAIIHLLKADLGHIKITVAHHKKTSVVIQIVGTTFERELNPTLLDELNNFLADVEDGKTKALKKVHG